MKINYIFKLHERFIYTAQLTFYVQIHKKEGDIQKSYLGNNVHAWRRDRPAASDA